jgi:hypothetical protein
MPDIHLHFGDCVEVMRGMPAGSGTTGAVALQLGRSFVGIDLNQAYLDLARERIAKVEAIPA